LGLRFGEAETILTEYSSIAKHKLYDEILREYGDYSCFVLQMLANIYRYCRPMLTQTPLPSTPNTHLDPYTILLVKPIALDSQSSFTRSACV
jgi:hypothetical protein